MIFYFTGTGNSLYAANTLGEALGEEVHNLAENLKRDELKLTVGEGEILGLVFPVYYYSLPTVVEEFLEKIAIIMEKGSRCFILATCGATTGDATKTARDILNKKGVSTDFVFSVEMPDNYILLYDVQDKGKQEKMLINSKDSLKRIIEIIKEDKKGDYNKIKGPMPGIMSLMAGAIYRRDRKTSKFNVSDRCTNCNLCQEICPVDAIEMKEGKPIWIKDKCVHCLACIHRCPVGAIQYGKKTESRGRYINPLSGL
ncbi:EFR1 family ferrodoxin [Gudongella sp. DL1XJH-153]|uniref:EFR1 family ferrodoxin n=1 Tax=Gudongella sp. DL1XJH-153 TaxID=3409804 RepID=UPI003BB7351E